VIVKTETERLADIANLADMDVKKVAEQRARAMFNDVAREAGMVEGAIDLAFPVAALEPSIAPNYAKTLERVEGMRKTHAFLFGPAQPEHSREEDLARQVIADDDPRWLDAGWQASHQDEIMRSIEAKQRLNGI
jgi:hypothetical protein